MCEIILSWSIGHYIPQGIHNKLEYKKSVITQHMQMDGFQKDFQTSQGFLKYSTACPKKMLLFGNPSTYLVCYYCKIFLFLRACSRLSPFISYIKHSIVVSTDTDTTRYYKKQLHWLSGNLPRHSRFGRRPKKIRGNYTDYYCTLLALLKKLAVPPLQLMSL